MGLLNTDACSEKLKLMSVAENDIGLGARDTKSIASVTQVATLGPSFVANNKNAQSTIDF